MNWTDSPENLALVRAALEHALREMLAADLAVPVDERGEFFLSYVHGRFGLDTKLVNRVSPNLFLLAS